MTDMTDTARMAERLRGHLDADDAVDHLRHYLTPGAFAGAHLDTLGGRGDAKKVADRFTVEDLAAISTLGRAVRGQAVIELLQTGRERWSALLGDVPRRRALHKASDDYLAALSVLADELDAVSGIGPVTRARLLARKRPTLVSTAEPSVIRALTGNNAGEFSYSLRDAMQGEGIVARLKAIRAEADAERLSLVRVVDIVVWMRSGGAEASMAPDAAGSTGG